MGLLICVSHSLILHSKPLLKTRRVSKADCDVAVIGGDFLFKEAKL